MYTFIILNTPSFLGYVGACLAIAWGTCWRYIGVRDLALWGAYFGGMSLLVFFGGGPIFVVILCLALVGVGLGVRRSFGGKIILGLTSLMRCSRKKIVDGRLVGDPTKGMALFSFSGKRKLDRRHTPFSTVIRILRNIMSVILSKGAFALGAKRDVIFPTGTPRTLATMRGFGVLLAVVGKWVLLIPCINGRRLYVVVMCLYLPWVRCLWVGGMRECLVGGMPLYMCLGCVSLSIFMVRAVT